MAGIRFNGVSKRYGNGRLAVSELSLAVEDGEFVVIVGPSGCGKSTTLRLVAGLENVTNGEIHLNDRCINDVAPGERDVAMVFQNYALYPHLTGRDNMAFGMRTRKLPKPEIAKRIHRAAELLSIQTLLDRRPEEMSGGERQRIALGRAVVREPAAFLFDEPLSNLDAQLRVRLRVQLAELHQRLKTTTLYVTHDQSEAMTLADRLVVLHNGVLQQLGTPTDVYDTPANRFVAGFIGNPAMNFVLGEVDGGRFRADGVDCPLTGLSIGSGPYTLGFRPEDASFSPGEQKLAEAKVVVVENLGNETIAYCRVGSNDESIAVRTARDCNARIGDNVSIHLANDRIHLFATDGDQQRL